MSESNTINFIKTIAASANDGYYRGQFLIATPIMTGKLFARGVIYIFAHNEGGAMGIVINKPLDTIHYASLFKQLGLEVGAENRDMSVYHGGPLEENRGFVVHGDDYRTDDTIAHSCGIAVTASMNILRDLSRGTGPKNAILSVGYAGWAAGQLESEIEANYWITAPASPDVVFNTLDEAKYAVAAKTLGVDMMRFSPYAGHA